MMFNSSMLHRKVYLLVLGIISCYLVLGTEGHGRLMEPPGRSTMWRFGFPSPINYDDDQLYCGGFSVQWDDNNGKCGVCGDAYSDPQPRDNEVGGKYYSGIIVRNYKKGDVINATVQMTTNHYGYFEFRLCPNNDFSKESTQKCLDQYVLELADGSGTKYYIPPGTPDSFDIKLQVKLPADVTCFQCFFQWHWWTASNWGVCPDGHGAQGCGPQEVFRGCADVAIA